MDLYNAVILDTETTGLRKADQVCELSIIAADSGEVLLDTLVRPSVRIDPYASRVHGITEEMVRSAPAWPELHDRVSALLKGRCVIIYQMDFDLRLLEQTTSAYDLRLPRFHALCAMRWLTDYLTPLCGEKPKWPKLTEAAEMFGVVPQGTAHRALADVLMTRDVIRAVLAEDLEHE